MYPRFGTYNILVNPRIVRYSYVIHLTSSLAVSYTRCPRWPVPYSFFRTRCPPFPTHFPHSMPPFPHYFLQSPSPVPSSLFWRKREEGGGRMAQVVAGGRRSLRVLHKGSLGRPLRYLYNIRTKTCRNQVNKEHDINTAALT